MRELSQRASLNKTRAETEKSISAQKYFLKE
jgi:hypothetical protein